MLFAFQIDRRISSDDLLEDVGLLDAGEPGVEALELDAEGVVVDAELVEHRRVQVVDGAHVLDGGVAQLVRRAVDEAAANAAPASQTDIALLWWSRPSPPCDIGVRPNSPAQTIKVSSSMPRCFRSTIRAMQARSISWAFRAIPSFTPP